MGDQDVSAYTKMLDRSRMNLKFLSFQIDIDADSYSKQHERYFLGTVFPKVVEIELILYPTDDLVPEDYCESRVADLKFFFQNMSKIFPNLKRIDLEEHARKDIVEALHEYC